MLKQAYRCCPHRHANAPDKRERGHTRPCNAQSPAMNQRGEPVTRACEGASLGTYYYEDASLAQVSL